jgi:putative transcriptional regulator
LADYETWQVAEKVQPPMNADKRGLTRIIGVDQRLSAALMSVQLIETPKFTRQLGSVREAGAILRGQKKPSRRYVIDAPRIRRIREGTRLSQSEFARLIGVSVKTLQNWEQDRRRPTGPAAALLKIIAHQPQLAVEAIHRA